MIVLSDIRHRNYGPTEKPANEYEEASTLLISLDLREKETKVESNEGRREISEIETCIHFSSLSFSLSAKPTNNVPLSSVVVRSVNSKAIR